MKKSKSVQAKGTLTDRDVDDFRRYLRRWQILLNLNDWRIELSHKPASKGTLAEVVKSSLADRLAGVRLNRDWGDERDITPLTKERTALHEDLHVLLKPLREFAAEPGVHEADVDAMEHAVIVALVNLLVPDEDMLKMMRALGLSWVK